MNTTRFFDHYMIRHPSVPAAGYLAAVIVLLVIVTSAGVDVAEHYRAVTTSTEYLMRLEQHKPASSTGHSQLVAGEPPGSPFLEGQTVTIASAALLQRITDAITHAGGTVVSSEVVPQDSHTKDGFVRITATCELEQTALQNLLYDIEAGMPFLFVDQLSVEGAVPGSASTRIRAVLEISGLWPGTKSK
jgi:general secretion pathway protein M